MKISEKSVQEAYAMIDIVGCRAFLKKSQDVHTFPPSGIKHHLTPNSISLNAMLLVNTAAIKVEEWSDVQNMWTKSV